MWVRNQSKDKLFNVNFFEIAKFIKDGNYRYDVLESQFSHNDYYIYSQDAGILGVYKSKERAIEVLDEIQKKISFFEFGRCRRLLSHQDVIFEMPKE